jgi:3-phenylpropionate/cinnamic acid dioxygenase small subunit
VDDKENCQKASNMYLKETGKEIVSVRINGVIFKLQNTNNTALLFVIDVEENMFIQTGKVIIR